MLTLKKTSLDIRYDIILTQQPCFHLPWCMDLCYTLHSVLHMFTQVIQTKKFWEFVDSKNAFFSNPPIFQPSILKKWWDLAHENLEKLTQGHVCDSTYVVVRLSERRPFYSEKCLFSLFCYKITFLDFHEFSIFFSSLLKSGTNYGVAWI